MKTLGNITKEGFAYSREFLNFVSQSFEQLEGALSKLTTNGVAFITGGELNTTDDDFTIADGEIAYQGKLYKMNGGTFNGAPADYYVTFSTEAASGFPEQDFSNNIGVTETVFFERVGTITTSSTGLSVPLTDVLPSRALNGEWQEVDLTQLGWGGNVAPTSSVTNEFNSIRYRLGNRKIDVKFMLEVIVSAEMSSFTILIPSSILNYAMPNGNTTLLFKPIVVRKLAGQNISYINGSFRLHKFIPEYFYYEMRFDTTLQQTVKHQFSFEYSLEI